MEHNSSSERVEEIKTPDSLEEGQEEDVGKMERSDSKSSPQAGRRYGVQVMGSGLLAEMKAKQERRAASAHKVRGAPPDLIVFVALPPLSFYRREMSRRSPYS